MSNKLSRGTDGDIFSILPAGTVLPFAGDTAPTGWAICNGDVKERTKFPELFSAIGVFHGSGDGSTTFRLPDYRGRFLRGVDTTGVRDPDYNTRTADTDGNTSGVGSNQGDAIRNITGALIVGLYAPHNNTPVGSLAAVSIGGNRYDGTAAAQGTRLEFDASGSVPTGGDNRPKNSSIYYIIRLGAEIIVVAPPVVPSVGTVGPWSSSLKDSTIALSSVSAINDTATSTDIDRRLIYGDLTTVGDGTYGTAKVFAEFIINLAPAGGSQDNQMVGFNVTAITPSNFDAANARGDSGFSLKWQGSQDLVFISPTNQFTIIQGAAGVASNGMSIMMALDTVNETIALWRNGLLIVGTELLGVVTGVDYTTGFDLGNDFTGQDIYVSAQLSSALGNTSEVEINSSATIPSGLAGQGFTLI